MTNLNTITYPICSTELLAIINQHREANGKNPMEHYNFMRSIKDELEEAALKFEGSYKGADNTDRPCYKLPKEEALQVAMRESKEVRKAVVKVLKDIEGANSLQEAKEAIAQAWNLAREVGKVEHRAVTDKIQLLNGTPTDYALVSNNLTKYATGYTPKQLKTGRVLIGKRGKPIKVSSSRDVMTTEELRKLCALEAMASIAIKEDQPLPKSLKHVNECFQQLHNVA
ncbi:TPA: hypothetical protein PMC50_002831 [Vibrio cholerae]|nr:hypothetical protein [Vibrio cholerae]